MLTSFPFVLCCVSQMQDKMNECLKNLREMKEIEIQLKVDPCITTSYASEIDEWLRKWKMLREADVYAYTCLLGPLGYMYRRLNILVRK